MQKIRRPAAVIGIFESELPGFRLALDASLDLMQRNLDDLATMFPKTAEAKLNHATALELFLSHRSHIQELRNAL